MLPTPQNKTQKKDMTDIEAQVVQVPAVEAVILPRNKSSCCCSKHAIWIIDIVFVLVYGAVFLGLRSIDRHSQGWDQLGYAIFLIFLFLIVQVTLAIANLVVTLSLWRDINVWLRGLGLLPAVLLAVWIVVSVVVIENSNGNDTPPMDCSLGDCKNATLV